MPLKQVEKIICRIMLKRFNELIFLNHFNSLARDMTVNCNCNYTSVNFFSLNRAVGNGAMWNYL